MSDFAAFGDSSLPTGDGTSGGDPFSGGSGMDLSSLGMGGPFQSAFPSGFNYNPPNAPSQVVGTANDPAAQAAYQGQQNAPQPPQPQTPNWVQDAYRSLLGGQQNAASPSMQAMAAQAAQQTGEGWGPGLKGLMNQASPQDIQALTSTDDLGRPINVPTPANITSGLAPPTGTATARPTAAQTSGLTGGVTQDPTTGGGQAPTALPQITVRPDQPDTATTGAPPDAKTVKTAPVTGGPTGAIPGDVTQGTATPSAATTPPATTPPATNPPQSAPDPGNNTGQGPYGGQFGGPQGPLGGILGMIVQAIGGLLGIDVGDFLRQLGMPDGQNMAGNQDWRSNAGQPGDPWYGKPLSPNYGPDPLQQPPTTTSPGQPTPGGTPSPQQGGQPPGQPSTVTPGAHDPSMQRGDPFTTGTPSRGVLGETPPAGTPPAAGTPVATTRPTQQVGGPAQQGPANDSSYIGGLGGHSTLNGQRQSNTNGLNPDFGNRLAAAGRAYQQETGQNPEYGEGYRDNATQQMYWNRLQGGRLGPVAPPGRSLHNRGLAMDMPSRSGFTRWLQQGNAQRFGLGFPVRNDPNHIQMTNNAGRAYPYTPHPETAVGGGVIPGAMATGPGGGPAGNRMAAAPPGAAAMATSRDPQQRATATHSGLAQARQPFAAQLQNPNTARLLAASTAAEVGGQGPLAEQAYIESVLNRAASRGMSLDQALTSAHSRGGYYPDTTINKLGRTPSAADAQRIQQITQRVLAGSNVANFGTGNASGKVSFAGGPMTYNPGTGERFGIEGPDRAWAQRVQGGNQAAQRVGNVPGPTTGGTNWRKFEAEARPSQNIEDVRSGDQSATFAQRDPYTSAGAQAYGGGTPTGNVGGLTRGDLMQAAQPQPAQPPPAESRPYNRNVDDLGRPIPDVNLPEITVKPPTAQAADTAPAKRGQEDVPLPRPRPKQRPKGMTKGQRRSIQRRQAAQQPPPVPKLGPYGSTSAGTAGYVQPGDPRYGQSMRYYYGQ